LSQSILDNICKSFYLSLVSLRSFSYLRHWDQLYIWTIIRTCDWYSVWRKAYIVILYTCFRINLHKKLLVQI
jgi:hypothetical protein